MVSLLSRGEEFRPDSSSHKLLICVEGPINLRSYLIVHPHDVFQIHPKFGTSHKANPTVLHYEENTETEENILGGYCRRLGGGRILALTPGQMGPEKTLKHIILQTLMFFVSLWKVYFVIYFTLYKSRSL
jgi:hypothetical protein